MPRGFWKHCPYYPSIVYYIFSMKTDNHKEEEYYYALARLVKLIYENETKIINYNHLPFIYPKSPIPLRFENQHRDISYLDRNNTLVFLLLDVIPYKRIPKGVKAKLWQS